MNSKEKYYYMIHRDPMEEHPDYRQSMDDEHGEINPLLALGCVVGGSILLVSTTIVGLILWLL